MLHLGGKQWLPGSLTAKELSLGLLVSSPWPHGSTPCSTLTMQDEVSRLALAALGGPVAWATLCRSLPVCSLLPLSWLLPTRLLMSSSHDCHSPSFPPHHSNGQPLALCPPLLTEMLSSPWGYSFHVLTSLADSPPSCSPVAPLLFFPFLPSPRFVLFSHRVVLLSSSVLLPWRRLPPPDPHFLLPGGSPFCDVLGWPASHIPRTKYGAHPLLPVPSAGELSTFLNPPRVPAGSEN